MTTLGVPVFSRYNKLERLLRQSEKHNGINKVIVGDNGKKNSSDPFYSGWDITIEVVDLEHGVGVSAARNSIFKRADERLLLIDSDILLPPNINRLHRVLDEDETLGGVSGMIVEPETGKSFLTGANFKELDNKLIKKALRSPKIDLVNGVAIYRADYISLPGLYRTSIIEDQSWDEEYNIHREHLDFFISHWKESEWEFATTPEVVFHHYPSMNTGYAKNIRRNEESIMSDNLYFLDKWEYESLNGFGNHIMSSGPNNHTDLERAVYHYQKSGIKGLLRRGIKKIL
ncbi:glycosyltransferase family 2 protein [Halapricum desulfuricans]|uniref:glycosyltransferase family 2 protein n=1 Tax=Halapricum desulfuricans TaxID=2841257 RepID=UPI001E322BB2|nr:glycosyltransferase [Halapricum desulfuricans]